MTASIYAGAGMLVGAILMVAFYELIVLPLIVGKPRALWGRWPIEAQSAGYERGFQNATERAARLAEDRAETYEKLLREGLVDHGLHCKAAAAAELATSIRTMVSD